MPPAKANSKLDVASPASTPSLGEPPRLLGAPVLG